MQQMRWKPLRVSPLPQHCAPGPAWALSGTCQMMGREKVVAGSILVHCWHIIQLSAKKSGEREKRSRCTVSAEPLQSQSPGAGGLPLRVLRPRAARSAPLPLPRVS